MPALRGIIDKTLLQQCQAAIQAVTVEESIFGYIVGLAEASRNSDDLILGGSPRASISLLLASKTYAAMQGRDYILPDRCEMASSTRLSPSDSAETRGGN